jgi:hypothetical protein
MPAIRTTRRLLSAYAEQEPGKGIQNETLSYLDVEERLAWGVHIFRGLLDLEARAQAHALRRPSAEVELLLEVMPVFYRLWAEVSEHDLERAKESVQRGDTVEGLEQFQETLEEARCLLGTLGLEDLLEQARPENPRPERYLN